MLTFLVGLIALGVLTLPVVVIVASWEDDWSSEPVGALSLFVSALFSVCLVSWVLGTVVRPWLVRVLS